MFLEPNLGGPQKGWIEAICGCMFSGKTEELIRRLKRAKIANKKVEIFKPLIDQRYAEDDVVSHDRNHIRSTPVSNSQNILLLTEGVEVIGIDEAQFFDENLPEVLQKLANRGSRVIIAALDMDYLGNPFGPVPEILAMAEFVTKLQAICAQCGSPASMSFRKNPSKEQVLVGEKDAYEPRCRYCYVNID